MSSYVVKEYQYIQDDQEYQCFNYDQSVQVLYGMLRMYMYVLCTVLYRPVQLLPYTEQD